MSREDQGSVLVTFEEGLEAHVFRFSGPANVPLILEEMGRVYRTHDPGRPLNIVFVDDGLTTFPSKAEFAAMVEFSKTHRPLVSGRTAMVSTNQVSFGIFRMAEGLGGEFFEHQRVFRTMEEALSWIMAGRQGPKK